MNYGRDYGNRNFLERAANTVRGWVGGRRGGGDDRWYDDEYRGGMMNRGWDDDRGYREMGDVSGYRAEGMNRGGYGGANWRGYNDDWNRGMSGGWGRGGGDEYRTGGYNARHGGWDVDWDQGRSGGYDRGMGMDRGGYGGGGERDHYMGRDFMTNHPHFGHDWRSGHSDDAMVDQNRGEGLMGRGMDRGGMGGGMMARGMNRGWDEDRTLNRGYDAGYGRYGAEYGARGMERDRGGMMDRGGMGGSYGGGGMLSRDNSVGDVNGGMIGNYGAYGNYGIERFRSGSAGGVPSGQHFTGYGVGSGYRG